MGSQYAKPPIEPFQFARNGKYPDSLFQGEMADLANKLGLYRGKQLFEYFSHTLLNGPDGDTERVRWRFAFRASPYANAIGAIMWMAQWVPESPASDPYARLRIETGAPATLGDLEAHYGAATTASSAPSNLVPMFGLLTSGGSVALPVAGTEYYGTVSDFQSRIIGISVFEMTQGATVPFHEGYAAGTSILDRDRQELVAGARLLWKYGAAHLFNWSMDDASAPRTWNSVTDKNVVDNTSTGVSIATPGFTLDLRNRSTTRRGTVPVTIKAFASTPDEGYVRLKDSTGADVAEIVINTPTASWHSTTANLPATLAKYDLHYASNGLGDVLSLYSASAYQDETGT